MSINLGTLPIVGNVKTTFEAPNEGVQAILIGNESGLTVTITMQSGGVQKTLYPSTVDWFTVNKGFNGIIQISPLALLNNVANWPSSSLVFDAIGNNDTESPSNYPLAMTRNANVGNVASVGTSSTNIQNDNQALVPSNVFVEATPTGAGSSTVSIATDGTVTIKGDVANVLTTLLQLLPAAGAGASSVKLGDAARQTEVLGSLLVDGAGTGLTVTNDATITGKATISNRILANLIKTITGNDLTLDVETAHKIALQVNDVDVVDITSTGITSQQGLSVVGTTSLDNGGITTSGSGELYASNGFTGSSAGAFGEFAYLISRSGQHTLTDWNFGFQSISSSGSVINHGLHDANGNAAEPSAIFCQNGTGTAGVTYRVTAPGTTSFTATASSTVNSWWIAVLA